MTIVLIGIASIVLSLLLLWGLDKYASKKSAAPDVAAALRELLIARAEGRIDQEAYDRQQLALHATLLQSPAPATAALRPAYLRWLIPSVVVVGVALAAWFVSSSSTPKAVDVAEFSKLPGGDTEKNPQANSGGDLNTVVKRLADKMAKDPGNGEGWLLLAKTYGELRQYAEEAAAYEKAAAILPPDATMLADWADSYVMSKNGKWDGAAQKIVKRALSTDPKHIKTLALAGSEAFSREDYKAAIDFWKRMKAAAPADSMDGKLADANIAEANSMLSGKKPAPAAAPEAAAAPGVGVGGVITLSPKLSAKVSPQDTVFVFAKAPGEAGPPLAAKRFKGSDFPIRFQLDDSASIMPGRVISKFSEVQVSAKVSKTGDASAQAGDISGAPVTAKLGDNNLKLELNSER